MQARAAATFEGKPVEVGFPIGSAGGVGAGGGVGSTGSGIQLV